MSTTTRMISITSGAAEAFAGFDWSENEGKGVRLFVQGFGCSGPSFGMALDEAKAEDITHEENGINFMVDARTADIINQGGGLKIDYINEQHRRGYMLELASPQSCSSSAGGCSGCG